MTECRRTAGRVALITGAAHGIGAATARRLAAEGATVVVTDVDDPTGEALAADIQAGAGRSEYVRCDVTSAADWEYLAHHVEERHGRLDVLHSNAFAPLKDGRAAQAGLAGHEDLRGHAA